MSIPKHLSKNVCGIYKITSPSGRVYIGQSRCFKSRLYNYINVSCESQKLLYKSLFKYGWNNHLFEIKIEVDSGIEQNELDALEIFYIKYYKDLGCQMLNLTNGGSGTRRDKLFNITKEDLFELYITLNLKRSEIAEYYNCKPRLIKKYISDFNLRKSQELQNIRQEELRSFNALGRIYEQEILSLFNSGISYREITEILNLPKTIVPNTIARLGLMRKQKLSFKKLMHEIDGTVYSLKDFCNKFNIKETTVKEDIRLNRNKFKLIIIN